MELITRRACLKRRDFLMLSGLETSFRQACPFPWIISGAIIAQCNVCCLRVFRSMYSILLASVPAVAELGLWVSGHIAFLERLG